MKKLASIFISLLMISSIFMANVFADLSNGLYVYSGDSNAEPDDVASHYSTSVNVEIGDAKNVYLVYVNGTTKQYVSYTSGSTDFLFNPSNFSVGPLTNGANIIGCKIGTNYDLTSNTYGTIKVNVTAIANPIYVYTGSGNYASDTNTESYSSIVQLQAGVESELLIVDKQSESYSLLSSNNLTVPTGVTISAGNNGKVKIQAAQPGMYKISYGEKHLLANVSSGTPGGQEGDNQGLDYGDSTYNIADGDYVFKYGIFLFQNDGKLFSTGSGDAEELGQSTIDYYFGIGLYNKNALSENTATNANATVYENIEVVNAYMLNLDKTAASADVITASSPEAVTINGVTTYKSTIAIKTNTPSRYYFYMDFKFKNDATNTIHSVYRKILVKKNQEALTLELDVSNKTTAQISSVLTNVYTNYKSIDPVTGSPQGNQDIIINFTNVPTNRLSGNIEINITPSNTFDFNNYIINGNGIKIDGSIINTGKTIVAIKNFNLENKTDSVPSIAINPQNGDINVDSCTVVGYGYGYKTTKASLEGATAGNASWIKNSSFIDCSIAGISIENNKIYNGLNYSMNFINNTFNSCEVGFEINDLIDGVSTSAIAVTNSYFLNSTTCDFKVSHTQREANVGNTEYFIFYNNYYSDNATRIHSSNYRSAKVVKDETKGSVIVSTSPAMMYPESQISSTGIDRGVKTNSAPITMLKSGSGYELNTNSISSLYGATIVMFDPNNGMPCGTSELGGKRH